MTTPSRRRRARLGTVLALGAAAALAAVPAAPAVALTSPHRYVALGDSYSAGNGTAARTNSCYQSRYAYPLLVARATGWVLDQHACASATIADITATQLPAVDRTAAAVSVTGGGNDAGFTDGVLECALPGWMGNCTAKLDVAQALIGGAIPRRLDALYGSIAAQAPQAQRYAVLYPHLFQGSDCSALTFFSPAEQARINQLTDALDDASAKLARAHGMAVVDPRSAFRGHAWCDATPWINGPTLPVADSYHPNRSGNAACAEVLLAAAGRSSATVTTAAAAPPTSRRSPTAADYRTVAPGLASRTNLAKARRAGISVTTVKAIDAGLRSGNLPRQQLALHQLQVMEQRWERTHR